MTRRRGFALGIGITLLASYAVAAVGFFEFAPPLLRASSRPPSLEGAGTGRGFAVAMFSAAGAAVVIAGLQVAFMVHACRIPLRSRRARALWLAALFLGSVVVMPFFWYLHVWRPAVPAADVAPTDERPLAAEESVRVALQTSRAEESHAVPENPGRHAGSRSL
ncbi:MAG TPA: hypothetical protein VMF70_01020 [Gemmatimonadales bacterium]|nr:hypothetical protein [Gemmatimonadales bacterium]